MGKAPSRWSPAPLLQTEEEQGEPKEEQAGRKRADCPANSTNPQTTLLRAAAQEPRTHTTWTLSLHGLHSFPKNSLPDLKLRRAGSPSPPYAQGFALPRSAGSNRWCLLCCLTEGTHPSGYLLLPLTLSSPSPVYSTHYGPNDLCGTENLIVFLRGSKPFNSFPWHRQLTLGLQQALGPTPGHTASLYPCPPQGLPQARAGSLSA